MNFSEGLYVDELKVGLVLSGGGAKGAYQVGVMRALAEVGAQIDMVAGASIGALNGAIVASAVTPQKAHAHLALLWDRLAQTSPVEFQAFGYLTLLSSAGAVLAPTRALGRVLKAARVTAAMLDVTLPKSLDMLENGLASDKPLKALMDEYLDRAALNAGLPLYVSLFRSQAPFDDLLRIAAAEVGIEDTPASTYVHVQGLPEAEQKAALLASAAIPAIYAAKTVNGERYSDGGIGGWRKMQGNTPAGALLDAGCNMLIVSHLSDDSPWSRRELPQATVLEIRPQRAISRDPSLLDHRDLLGFDPKRIPSWVEQGYEDTLACAERVMRAGEARRMLRESERILEAKRTQHIGNEARLADSMAHLRRY